MTMMSHYNRTEHSQNSLHVKKNDGFETMKPKRTRPTPEARFTKNLRTNLGKT